MQQPSIVHYEPEVLNATLDVLGASLELPRGAVLALVKKQPLYLVQPHLARENLLASPQVLGAPGRRRQGAARLPRRAGAGPRLPAPAPGRARQRPHAGGGPQGRGGAAGAGARAA
jgi:hypothetical protein